MSDTPDIYVDIGPMDSSKAPKEYAAKVKGYMQDTAEKMVSKAKGFTTSKKGEGFTVRLKVAELKVEGKSVSCKLTGELIRFPKPEMVSTGLTGNAKADGGKPEALVKDCVETVVEDMLTKRVIPAMQKEARQ